MKKMLLSLIKPLWLHTVIIISLFSLSSNVAASETACHALATTNFSNIQDAPTRVVSAIAGKTANKGSDYCEVQAYITPEVGIGLQFPLDQWNGRFLMFGCGGWCGEYSTVLNNTCPQYVEQGYACISTDMGHKGTMAQAVWAYNNLQAEVDFAFRATHVAVLSGKAIVSQFFGESPKHAYFMGCSQGGRQGLMQVQRFPDDFDGVVVGAPGGISGLNEGPLHILWSMRAGRDEEGESLFSTADIDLLNRSAISRCDSDDGVNDGVIGDPASCPFRPEELQCEGRKTPQCLSKEQVIAAQKIYAGPMTSTGERLAVSGSAIGSEHNWPSVFLNASPFYALMIEDPYRYITFSPDPGPSWDPKDFDFDRDPQRAYMFRVLQEVTNPDLRKFKSRGGKLIYFHGWDDAGIPPASSIDYYQTVTRTMGGREATEDFFRLFMVPGMDHCTGGKGAHGINYLSYLEAWVEQGKAPDKMIGIHPGKGNKDNLYFKPIDLDINPDQIEFTRPVYPYPKRAKYQGTGDPDNAASFMPYSPEDEKNKKH